ncbi:MAG: PAS domain S-box protein [Acidobacteria bacterium]|nr:PAS domain S-box protein [Acidobacteriota bacterium]
MSRFFRRDDERKHHGQPGAAAEPNQALAGARVAELEARVADLESQHAALAETLDRERLASRAGLEEAATLRLVLDHVPALVAYIDREERCRLASRTVEEWLGRSRQGLMGRRAVEILGPATYDRIQSFIRRAMDGETVTYTRAVAYREGDRRQVRASWVPTRDENGAVTGVCVIVHDVTELGQALEAVSESRELYRLLAETSPDFICQFDLDGTLSYISPASQAILGASPEEVVGTNFSRFFRPQDFPGVLAIFESVAAGERVGLIEFDALKADGSLVPVEVSGAPITRGGVVVGVLGIARDITERRRAQEGLRRYQERLEQLLQERGAQLEEAYARFDVSIAERSRTEQVLRDNEEGARAVANLAPVMLWESDLDAAVKFFNDAWLSFRGRTLAEEAGSGWLEGVHPEDREACLAAHSQAFRDRAPLRTRYRLRRGDGQYRAIQDDGVPRYRADGDFAGYIGCCVDVTEQG